MLHAFIYLLFFLSGAAALVYQLVWVRSLTLVFGGSHLAVTAVLSIFMAGLAIGGYVIGRRVDRVRRPLRLYGILELGIAASALAFAGLVRVYPAIYVALAQGRDESAIYLSVLRMTFSVVALLLPTVLMGGTLPVLSRFVSGQPEELRSRLSFLYGFNTLGAVAGSLVAGFYFLRVYAVSTTLYLAVATNLAIGVLSLLLQRRLDAGRAPGARAGGQTPAAADFSGADTWHEATPRASLPAALVLWGIGISGFCALGYEVLWTRVLTIAIGASVYSFTIILVAFLTGIAIGSAVYGALARVWRAPGPDARRLIAFFGLTQVVIGVTALLVTIYLRDIPANSVRLQNYLHGTDLLSFGSRTLAHFALAFLYMVVPAFFMGAAFPMAGEVLARQRRAVGRAVGEVLAYNTVGSILGAAVSGLVLIHLFGIERSLQLLALLNAGTGLAVLASQRRPGWLLPAVAAASLAAAITLAVNPDIARVWDRSYFAIFRSNQPEAFRTPEMVREAVENTDVLYYAEGIESIVSVIRVKGGEKAFLTNGRVEASSHLQAQQVQFTLGHLPMLLHPEPRDVLVVGMGSGMTAGATAVHPSVGQVTIVEIEPGVQGVARSFEEYNHRVLDHPKVKVIFNDGRNFLMTTDRMFDVITADPIHPWFRGAGYLYSSQYFALAARHLRPGGVIAQWLPIYELTPDDLRSVVRTFQEHFAYTLLWLTHYDAEIVGSNSPLVLDEEALERRLAAPEVAADLRRVEMGTPADLLSYFVMGTEGMRRFAHGGVLNTDDYLYLEFSAPFSIATVSVMSANVDALTASRESILPYLKPAAGADAAARQRDRWRRQLAAARVGDPALSLFLGGMKDDPRFVQLLGRLGAEHPWYAPGRFLKEEFDTAVSLEPRLIRQESFAVLDASGHRMTVEMAAVLVPISRSRASVMFVDNRARSVYGQVYVNDYDRPGLVDGLAVNVLDALRTAYRGDAAAAVDRGQGLPAADSTMRRFRETIASRTRELAPAS